MIKIKLELEYDDKQARNALLEMLNNAGLAVIYPLNASTHNELSPCCIDSTYGVYKEKLCIISKARWEKLYAKSKDQRYRENLNNHLPEKMKLDLEQ